MLNSWCGANLSPTEEHGFPKWLCVLRKCKYFGPLVNHKIETDVSEGAPIIHLNTHPKQGYCSIHGVVPTYSTTCHTCDTTTETDVVPGNLTFRKNFFKLEKNIGEFHQDYYIPSIERFVNHRFYYKIIGKKI